MTTQTTRWFTAAPEHVDAQGLESLRQDTRDREQEATERRDQWLESLRRAAVDQRPRQLQREADYFWQTGERRQAKIREWASLWLPSLLEGVPG